MRFKLFSLILCFGLAACASSAGRFSSESKDSRQRTVNIQPQDELRQDCTAGSYDCLR